MIEVRHVVRHPLLAVTGQLFGDGDGAEFMNVAEEAHPSLIFVRKADQFINTHCITFLENPMNLETSASQGPQSPPRPGMSGPSDSLLAHGMGHTIIRAVVGDHETLLQFPEDFHASDYQSGRSACSWMASAFSEFSEGDDPAPFLNGLCIQVAGYVGESVFGEQDTLLDMGGRTGWHRVGRGELVEAYQLCRGYAVAGVSPHEVLEACMQVVDSTLRKYLCAANTMRHILAAEGLLEGYRFAALLAEIKEVDLSIQVRQRLGLPH